MPDKCSPETRSYNMSRIRSKNTKPEEIVRKYLFSKGLRYRKNDKRFPGKPDLIFPKYKTAVFVNGCFWHWHEECEDFVLPKSNTEFWFEKLMGNKERDKRNIKQLQLMGWRVLIVWECELKKSVIDHTLQNLYNNICLK